MPNIVCTCCSRSYDSLSMLKCGVCKKPFKNTCVDISSSEVRMLNANKGCEWSCVNCRSISGDIKELKSLILQMQNDLQALRSERPPDKHSLSDTDYEELIAELDDRNKRKCNLMLYNVPEQDQSHSVAICAAHDRRKVSEIINALSPELDVENTKISRLGRFDDSKNRPIKVTLENEVHVNMIIRKAKFLKSHNLYKTISMSLDRTKRQMQYYKKVREELSEKINAGETNCKIKYINGVPKIVSSLN